MIAVAQRVSSGSVTVANEVVGAIELGFVVLLGVGRGDGVRESAYLAKRIHELRVFEDDGGRMNRDLTAVEGAVLAVPQFTLYANLRGGRRPDFLNAAPPEEAVALFDDFVAQLRQRGTAVETGQFGATMSVQLINEGPATFVFDTRALLDEPPAPARSDDSRPDGRNGPPSGSGAG